MKFENDMKLRVQKLELYPRDTMQLVEGWKCNDGWACEHLMYLMELLQDDQREMIGEYDKSDHIHALIVSGYEPAIMFLDHVPMRDNTPNGYIGEIANFFEILDDDNLGRSEKIEKIRFHVAKKPIYTFEEYNAHVYLNPDSGVFQNASERPIQKVNNLMNEINQNYRILDFKKFKTIFTKARKCLE